MVCHVEPVAVNHGELCWARGIESWCAIIGQWVGIMLCYAESLVVNYGVLF
jgi:hypothetical protein